jgi:ParB-like nuclease domain
MNSPVIRPTKSALIPLDRIDFPTNTRAAHADKVGELVKSIRLLGLQSPPTVVERKGRYMLVAGRHRIEALRVIGVDPVPVRIADFDDIEARLWTISENLHRNDLHPLHRAEQVAEWIRLTEEGRFCANAQKPQGGRPEGGVSLAARELGIDRDEARRSVKIDSIIPAAKAAAIETGIDRNQSALLKVASYADEDQVEAVAEIAKAKATPVPAEPTARPLRNLENLSGGELARWIKITTPDNMTHRIRVLRMAADILEDEIALAENNRMGAAMH